MAARNRVTCLECALCLIDRKLVAQTRRSRPHSDNSGAVFCAVALITPFLNPYLTSRLNCSPYFRYYPLTVWPNTAQITSESRDLSGTYSYTLRLASKE